MKQLLYLIGGLLLFCRCVDPLDLEGVVSGEPQLVVDAFISDQPESYQIRLSYSSTNLFGYQDQIITGAEVFVTDDEDSRYDFRGDGSGTYTSNTFEFQGEAGRTYQLHIRTPDGQEYASLEETMLPVPTIDSVFAQHESRSTLTSIGSVVDTWGMQFRVTTGSGDSRPGYYQWTWSETYEFMAPLVPEVLPPPIISICYSSGQPSRYLNIASSNDFTEDKIIGHPINYVSKRTYRLQMRYSLLVTQYSLTESAYTFWDNIVTQEEGGNSIFAPPPSPIPGNMYNVNDNSESVLGIFQVSAATQKRVFLRNAEVPRRPGGPPRGFSECAVIDEDTPAYCYDCRLIPGTTTERPSYW